MNTVEQRLRDAANETTHAAARVQRSPIPSQRRRGPMPVLVFAAAFVIVTAVVGLGPLLGRITSESADPQVSPGSPGTVADVLPATTIPESSDNTCSGYGAQAPAPTAQLPEAVGMTRDRILTATAACDIDGLSDLASEDLVTSFGGGGFENIVRWEEEGNGRLDTLVSLLGTQPGIVDRGNGTQIYVWPGAFAYESWEEIPADAIEDLHGIYTQEEIDQIAGSGSYTGWRVGIRDDGQWLYFVAGD